MGENTSVVMPCPDYPLGCHSAVATSTRNFIVSFSTMNVFCQSQRCDALMMVWKKITVTVFLLLLRAFEVSAPVNKSTCSAAPVKEGDSAKVTCHFGRDLSQTKEDFEIKHDNVTVKSCSRFGDKPDCQPQDSEHDGPITYTFDYIIPEAKLENSGHYKCQISQSTSLAVESCFLDVRADPSLITPVLTTENSSNTTSFKNGTLDDEDQYEISTRGLYFLYFLFLLLLVPLSVFYCINQNDDEESKTCSERGTPDKISDFENKDTEDSSQIETEIKDLNITTHEESNNVDTSFDKEGRSYPYQQFTESYKVLATDTAKDNSELSEPKPFNFENKQTKYPHEVNVTLVSETGHASLKEVKAQSGDNVEVSGVCPSPAITNTESIPLLEAKEEFAYNIADM